MTMSRGHVAREGRCAMFANRRLALRRFAARRILFRVSTWGRGPRLYCCRRFAAGASAVLVDVRKTDQVGENQLASRRRCIGGR
jgi:hypothetical protein